MTPHASEQPVRYYLAVLADLAATAQSLAAEDLATRGALDAFADLRALADDTTPHTPATPVDLADLWRPRDPERLTGLTDLYEVVGRYAFQGDDNQNLDAVKRKVAALRDELTRQRAVYEGLATLPARVVERAAAMESEELSQSRAQQEDALKQFEPEARQLRDICARLLDAVRAQKRPDLTKLDAAPAAYLEYVQRVQGLYGRALPALRQGLAELSRVAQCQVPPSWPDTLPFAATLPDDLVVAPPPESPALTQARLAAEAATAQETALQRAIDEFGVQLRRVDGELTALAQRDAAITKDEAPARLVVRWATKLDELDQARAHVAAIHEEGRQRTIGLTQVQSEVLRAQSTLQAMQREASEWAQAVTAKEGAVAEHKGNEPTLFGREDWRRKLDELELEVTDLRAELTRRQQGIAAGAGDVARLQGREQAEQAQIAVLTRQLDEAKAREASAQREVDALEKELGASRPARRMSVAEAEAALSTVWGARQESRQRVERLQQEQRRIREDGDRATVQLRQLTADKDRLAQTLAAALRQSNAGHEEALRTLGARRQAAFESHAQSVLSGLEESLTQVDRVFIDPARRALLVRAGVMSEAPGDLRNRAASLDAAIPGWRSRAEAVWAAQSAVLDRVETEFLAKAPAACRAAWRDA